MTATFDTQPHHKPRTRQTAAPTPRGNDDEPWPIWAALMVFLNVLVISAMIWGLAGLVTVMVPAALGMIVVLLLIVKG